MNDRIVFVGAGGTGLTAAFIIARKAPDTQITLFSKDPVVAYSQCGMPFVLDKKIPDFNRLIIYPPAVFKELGLDVRTETPVAEIEIDAHEVVTDRGDHIAYDKLVIATGSKPFVPPVPGMNLSGVQGLITLEDGKKLYEQMKTARNVVIVGGGPIGLETAPAFLDAGAKVTIVERMPQLMSSALDPELASIVQAHLEKKGARVITGKGVDSVNGSAHVESVTCGGETIPAELVLLSAGIRPNVDLAKKAGIETGVTGGIVVDEFFRVSRNGVTLGDVLAAGDCAEVKGLVSGKPVIYAVGSVANRQASYVADNLLGKRQPYPPVLCPTVCVIGDLQVGSVGLNIHTCEQAGIRPVTFSAKGLTRARYFPGGKKIDIKLISDGERLIGGQIISEEGVHGRINVLSLAIGKAMTPADLASAETAYAPPVSMLIDPLTYCAEMLALKCARAKKAPV